MGKHLGNDVDVEGQSRVNAAASEVAARQHGVGDVYNTAETVPLQRKFVGRPYSPPENR